MLNNCNCDNEECSEEDDDDNIMQPPFPFAMPFPVPGGSGGDPLDIINFRSVGIFGEITEEMSSSVIFSLLALRDVVKDEKKHDEKSKPIQMVISSFGGSATDMFAIYDTMRLLRKITTLKTYGLGKVMSGGVILLAAGTKGYRKVGRNCRLMLHSVSTGNYGALHDLENELKETQWMQQQYIKVLAKETGLKKKTIKKILSKRLNVYLTAEEAIEMGIADKIV